MCTFTDAEWIRLLKEEPRSAKVERCLWEELYRFCWFETRNHGLDEQAATDCAVDAFQRVVRSISAFRFECSFRSWWRIIAANCVKTISERTGRRTRREQPLPETEAEEPGTPDTFTNIRADEDMILTRLLPCLGTLPKSQREVIEMRYLTRDASGVFVEQSVDVVAVQLGKSTGAVATASAHARGALRRCLESSGYRGPDDILSL